MDKSSEVSMIKSIVTICIMTFHLYSFAQSPAQSQPTSANQSKSQNIDFEDELVEGTAQKPDLFYLFQKKDVGYNKLIKLRENFLPEMRKTAEDIQRSRSGN